MIARRIRRCRVAPAYMASDLGSMYRLRACLRDYGKVRVTLTREVPPRDVLDYLAELREWARAKL